MIPSPLASLASASSAVSASPSKRTAPMRAPFSGPEARSQVMGGPACRKVPFSMPSASWAGRTSTRSAPAAVIRRSASALASSCRGSARTSARSAAVPSIGGCQAASVTATAWDRSVSAKSETPAVATETSADSRPRSGEVMSVLLGGGGEQGQRVAGGLGVGEEDGGAGPLQRGCAAVQALGVVLDAGEGDHHGQGPPVPLRRGAGVADGLGELVGGVLVRAVAEDEVEQQHPARRVLGLRR